MSNPRHEIPPSTRAVRRAARWIEGHARLVILCALLLAAVLWVLTGLYTVDNGEAAVVRRFGRLAREGIAPGLHAAWPAPVEEPIMVKTGEVHRVRIESDTGGELELITGDENLIETDIIVQYRVADLGRFLFRTETAEGFLTQAIRAALLETVSRMKVDDVLTSGKAAIQVEVRRRAQELLHSYRCGVTLLAVTLQAADPPVEAAAAFRRVSDARAEAARSVNNAESQRERELSLARA
ncbi:MAG: hypothetical protein GF355_15415, partial [Candidatus Eisenbacteria bacterium]|nr:hypothetical protein [Candidatus Eisenbacteria bacterium]